MCGLDWCNMLGVMEDMLQYREYMAQVLELARKGAGWVDPNPLVGAVVVTIVGLTKKTIGLAGLWDGIRIVFVGIFCKGRDAAGALEWGFNGRTVGNMLFRATPIIMTGLSVAVSYKTGLFNIGAPGQYLMGTMASLMIALGIPSSAMPAGLIIWTPPCAP